MDPSPFSMYDPRPSLEFVLAVLAGAGLVFLFVRFVWRPRATVL